MDVMNRDSAERCRDAGHKCFAAGNYEKAKKFYARSLRLYELPGVKARLQQTEVFLSTSSPKPAPRSTSSGSSGAGSAGTRRRAAAAPAPAPEATTRPYTAKAKDVADRICSCKDHYQVLGVDRKADSNTIRKAYRKLAVKVHPDKNSSPKASEAFKKVGAAYAVLSDEDKRAHYDRTGLEPGEIPRYSRGGRGGARAYQGELNPEDIFNMMFGGGHPAFRRTRVHTQHHHTQGDGQQQQQGGFGQLLQLLPLIILFALTMFSFGDRSKPMFSLDMTREYSTKRFTTHPRVISQLPYYVTQDFGSRSGRDLYNIESAVENATYNRLRKECSYSRQKQRQLNSLARRTSGQRAQQYLQQARDVKMGACEQLNAFKGRYFY